MEGGKRGATDAFEHVEVQVSCADAAEADAIAEHLVAGRLAAAVQRLPIRSVYRWKGRVERADEVLLLAKTTRARLPALADAVRERHSYETPAIAVLPIVDGTPDYLAWIAFETL